MESLRRIGLGRRHLIVVAVLVVILAVGLVGASRSSIGSGASLHREFTSERFGFSGTLAPGWHRTRERLVGLLMPREVLSVGTAPMPAGGGGSCGREPVAAIARMRRGDALISIQEYVVTARMRPLSPRTFPRAQAYSRASQIDLRPPPNPPGGRHGSAVLWSATLSFRASGRAFDALVYVMGVPTPRRLAQVASTLSRLRIEPKPPAAA